MTHYKNIHTGEIYCIFMKKDKSMWMQWVAGKVEKSKNPFEIKADWNKFNTFTEIVRQDG